MWQILRALNYMHYSLKIAHRDIKAENILLMAESENLTAKLCDFGFAIKSDCISEPYNLSKLVGSPYYIAPEVFNEAYDSRCDLWSMGILLYYMLSRSFPFTGQNHNEIFHNIKHGMLSFDGAQWENTSSQAKDLISRLLVRDPSIRLSTIEAIHHPFINKAFHVNKLCRTISAAC